MMFYFCTFLRSSHNILPGYFTALFSVSSNIKDPVSKMMEAVEVEHASEVMIMCRVISKEDYDVLMERDEIRVYNIQAGMRIIPAIKTSTTRKSTL